MGPGQGRQRRVLHLNQQQSFLIAFVLQLLSDQARLQTAVIGGELRDVEGAEGSQPKH